jgi:uncharacterized membrane protein YeaQ/YmgE (transglycosylase-associated protein family)
MEENFTNPVDPDEVGVGQTAIRYGIIGGLISIALSIASIAMGWNQPGNSMAMLVGILAFIILIGVLTFAIKTHRDDDLGGYITLGRAVKVGVLTAIIMGLLGAVFNVVHQTLIDPGYMDTMMEASRTQLEDSGMDDDQIDAALSMTSMFTSPIVTAIFGLISSAVIGAIISLIAGAIMKKENPYT